MKTLLLVEDESDQLELKAMASELGRTQGLIAKLSKQLADLQRQVKCRNRRRSRNQWDKVNIGLVLDE